MDLRYDPVLFAFAKQIVCRIKHLGEINVRVDKTDISLLTMQIWPVLNYNNNPLKIIDLEQFILIIFKDHFDDFLGVVGSSADDTSLTFIRTRLSSHYPFSRIKMPLTKPTQTVSYISFNNTIYKPSKERLSHCSSTQSLPS